MQCPTLVEDLDGSTGDPTDRQVSSDVSKKVNTRLRDIASLLPLGQVHATQPSPFLTCQYLRGIKFLMCRHLTETVALSPILGSVQNFVENTFSLRLDVSVKNGLPESRIEGLKG